MNLLIVLTGSLAIRCYQCYYTEQDSILVDYRGESYCKDNGDDIDDTKAIECSPEYDVCTFTYTGEHCKSSMPNSNTFCN